MRPLHLLLTVTLALLYAVNTGAEKLPDGPSIESDSRPESILEKDDTVASSTQNDTIITTAAKPTPTCGMTCMKVLIVLLTFVICVGLILLIANAYGFITMAPNRDPEARGFELSSRVRPAEPLVRGGRHDVDCDVFPPNPLESCCRSERRGFDAPLSIK